jgi:hypothetical protein
MDLVTTFPANYHAASIASLSEFEYRIYEFSGVTSEDEPGMLTVVYPVGAEPWIGRFSRGTGIGASVSGLWSLPNPDQILVSSWGQGYVANVFDPSQWRALDDVYPLMHVLSDRRADIVVLGDYVRLAGFGRQGLQWRTADLSWDGLFDLEIRGGEVVGCGWSAPDDTNVPFSVTLETGEASGGSSLERDGLRPL